MLGHKLQLPGKNIIGSRARPDRMEIFGRTCAHELFSLGQQCRPTSILTCNFAQGAPHLIKSHLSSSAFPIAVSVLFFASTLINPIDLAHFDRYSNRFVLFIPRKPSRCFLLFWRFSTADFLWCISNIANKYTFARWILYIFTNFNERKLFRSRNWIRSFVTFNKSVINLHQIIANLTYKTIKKC